MPSRTTIQASPPQLSHASRLIIASNRGPIEFYQRRESGKLLPRRGSGGLVTALMDVASQMDVTWVAMTMTEGDRLAVQQSKESAKPLVYDGIKLRYVSIPKEAYRKHYDKMSNEVLWFLQHYMYHLVEDQISWPKLLDIWENGYYVANRAIADAVCLEIAQDSTPAVVMLQDYHLYLAGEMIRQRYPDVVLQQFIHIPWPDMRCWYYLRPEMTQEIFRGLMGNDIIGFQTRRDARNFLDGVNTVLEGVQVDFEDGIVHWQGRQIYATWYPISISVHGERKALKSAAGRRANEHILPMLTEQTIMRVDRLEPTKNIVRGFQAYELLLAKHPELHGKVSFLAFLVPSRMSVPLYRRLSEEVKALIDEINRKYGTDSWQPIQAVFENDRVRALAAMQYYDVLFVNPITDGMNLVAKEGAIVNTKNGVLVLSRTAGAYEELAKCSISVSPVNIWEMADALYTALTLPEKERALKANLARLVVERHNLQEWLTTQMDDLNTLLDERLGPSVVESEQAKTAIHVG